MKKIWIGCCVIVLVAYVMFTAPGVYSGMMSASWKALLQDQSSQNNTMMVSTGSEPPRETVVPIVPSKNLYVVDALDQEEAIVTFFAIASRPFKDPVYEVIHPPSGSSRYITIVIHDEAEGQVVVRVENVFSAFEMQLSSRIAMR